MSGLIQNTLVFANSNAENMLKDPKIIAAGGNWFIYILIKINLIITINIFKKNLWEKSGLILLVI